MRVELLAIFIDQKSLECLSPKSISLCKSAAGSDWGPEPFGRAHQASHRGDWLMQRGCQPRQRRPKQPPDCGGSHSSGMVLGVVIRGSKKYLNLLVGVAGFEPATPASRTQCIFSKPLIYLEVAGVSATICSRRFGPIHCDIV